MSVVKTFFLNKKILERDWTVRLGGPIPKHSLVWGKNRTFLVKSGAYTGQSRSRLKDISQPGAALAPYKFARFVRLAGIGPATFWSATRRSIH